ncbi:MAG: ribonuclease III [Synergistaceae bacterium]|nr:ribonuclease III [Synergistaceae bacterium]
MTDERHFEHALGYFFCDRELFEEALTHASYANENGCARSNERLEFLGDAVLGLCVSERLFSEHPKMDEGELSKIRSRVVREATLASWALATNLPKMLKLGRGLEGQGGRHNPSILADAMEAVFGAVFLDGGYDASRNVVDNLAKLDAGTSLMKKSDNYKDPKSLLQELLQARGDKPPTYRLLRRAGPDHAAIFEVEATMADGSVLSSGSGNSIKAAEFKAAASALSVL